eukprot:4930360-Pyramimonas_sp.AAC.1
MPLRPSVGALYRATKLGPRSAALSGGKTGRREEGLKGPARVPPHLPLLLHPTSFTLHPTPTTYGM